MLQTVSDSKLFQQGESKLPKRSSGSTHQHKSQSIPADSEDATSTKWQTGKQSKEKQQLRPRLHRSADSEICSVHSNHVESHNTVSPPPRDKGKWPFREDHTNSHEQSDNDHQNVQLDDDEVDLIVPP